MIARSALSPTLLALSPALLALSPALLALSPALLALSLTALLGSCGRSTDRAGVQQAEASPAASKGELKSVDAATFKSLADAKKGIFLDVRTPGEVSRAHIPSASVVDIGDPKFTQKISKMARDGPVFVYCASGARSAAAGRQLVSMGFAEVYNLSGGLGSWAAAGYPVERGSPDQASGEGMDTATFDALIRAESQVLIDFHTPWCAPCKKVAPLVQAVGAARVGKLKVVQIDVDASEELALREEIQGVPVLVLYRAGKEVWRHAGEIDQVGIEQAVDRP